MKLVLGVIDVPYTGGTTAPRRVVTRRRGNHVESFTAPAAGQQTTGDVATWLEQKYDVVGTFYGLHETEIAASLAESMAGALETLLQGGKISARDALAQGTSAIQSQFKKFLSSAEMEHLGVPGVPTKAALARRENTKKSGRTGPSFVDTGLYRASFKVWVTD